MPTPIIGYENIFENGPVTVTHEHTDFPKENLFDWLTYSAYKPNSASATVLISVHLGYGTTCDYVGIAGHNLGSTGATAVLQYNSGSGWNNCHTVQAPSDDDTIFITFPSVSAEDYRLSLGVTSVNTSIGILAAGDRLEIPRGPTVGWAPPLINSYELMANFSESNASLGRSLKTRFQTTQLEFSGLTESFVRASWLPFVEHAKKKPFFFMWDSVNNASEVALLHTVDKIQNPAYVSKKHMSVSLSCKVEK